jgi:hypothetical protein
VKLFLEAWLCSQARIEVMSDFITIYISTNKTNCFLRSAFCQSGKTKASWSIVLVLAIAYSLLN